MANMYYMGAKHGTAKASGNPFYVVNILRLNRFNDWEVSRMFTDQQVYQQVKDSGLVIGYPVIPSVDMDGRLFNLELNESAQPIEL